MQNAFLRAAAFGAMLLPLVSQAEPTKLKLAFFSSDRSITYLAVIKPFVDAVNAEAENTIRIDVAFSGALGKDPAQQLQLVLDGIADLAFVVPGYTPARFPDNAVIELPGLFKDMREATLTYSAMIAANSLRGYEDLFVVGAFANDPETIHTRTPAATLPDFKGLRIRVNNPVQATALTSLGMTPVQLPINQAPSAISSGKLDGSAAVPATLVEFGIARVTGNHYLLGVSAPPLLLVMNRQKFDGLTPEAQQIIRKFSGEWAAARCIEVYKATNEAAVAALKQDSNRKVVVPSPSDLKTAQAAFKAIRDEWAAASPRNRELLARANAALAQLRPTE